MKLKLSEHRSLKIQRNSLGTATACRTHAGRTRRALTL
ncbi:hypothetical protein PHLH8_34540 [Pseudomonas sp. Pc102]|nr:hypothetical protein PHLH8_34540 [Pseudomonas sp. Pc102]